ncbi:hypothetical protein GCM10010213_30830 [Microbacterium maritypicum]|uniref:Uncharacterized protein n=1 Tax=Microbacterium maritypicum TaxID=33918 RepID=A0A4Y4B8L4_MICMQ|nr:hypothetical protein MLI01_30560 [Microbacterium liquefaciens]GGV65200.1 hypothetical protein GCM10010213_30830 [Microbacterium liquefaciens]
MRAHPALDDAHAVAGGGGRDIRDGIRDHIEQVDLLRLQLHRSGGQRPARFGTVRDGRMVACTSVASDRAGTRVNPSAAAPHAEASASRLLGGGGLRPRRPTLRPGGHLGVDVAG